MMGGQSRCRLYLYEPGDPLSALWTELTVKQRRREFISRSEANRILREREQAINP